MTFLDDVHLQNVTSKGEVSDAARVVIPRDKLGEVIAALAALLLTESEVTV